MFKKAEGWGIKFRLEGSHIEITGILVGNFKCKLLRRPIWAWLGLF